jgi:hypothetical protein
MGLRELMLSEGVDVEATGRVVAVAGSVWFEPPLPRRLIYYPPESRPAPTASRLGVVATGVDLDRLDARFEKDGVVEGWAWLRGVWRSGTFQVGEQGPPQWSANSATTWDEPPYPPPVDGWPHGPVDENLEIPAELTTDEAVLCYAMFRPSPSQVVLSVATTDPVRIATHLLPLFGQRLCIVNSRWTREQVDNARAAVQAEMAQWQAYQAGLGGVGNDGQVLLDVKVVQVLPGLADWINTVPDGLVQVQQWLSPSLAKRD